MEACTPVTGGIDRTKAAKRGFWKRRVVEPLVSFLKQGSTPDALARAIAVGTVCGLFPLLGMTTLLGFLVGLLLRLNQPVIQAVNYGLGAAQILMIPAFVQAGAWIVGADPGSVSVSGMIDAFREMSFVEFIGRFGLAGLYALLAWTAAVPLIFAAVYFVARPLLERLDAARRGGEG